MIVLVAAVGATTGAGNAFTVANQLPNNIYAIVSTGLLSAVVVPQIVKAASHPDGGSAFVSRLFTLGTVVLLATTALAVIAAPWLVAVYAPGFPPQQQALATTFAYWCLPQVLFYGLYALVGETLNARRIYGPFTWAPVINNVVSIAGFVAFIVLFGQSGAVSGWTSSMATLLAGTATFGIVTQAGVLMLFWRRTGLHVRPDFRWRGVGVGQIGKLAGWTFLMVLGGQLAGLAQSRIISSVAEGDPGMLVAGNAWLLFMLPYSIIVLSIGTPYFTQLSEHAVAGRDEMVRTDIDGSIRTLGLFIAGATVALAAASVPASRMFTDSADEAVAAAIVLLCYLVGLIPLTVLFVVQRTFYAYGDTRTPFIFTIVQCTLVAATAWAASGLATSGILPLSRLTAGVALGQSLSSVAQVVLATWLLHRRLGGIRTGTWTRAIGRFSIAAVPAGFVGWGVFELMGGSSSWAASDKLLAVVGAAIILSLVLGVYVGILGALRTPELSPAANLVRRLIQRWF